MKYLEGDIGFGWVSRQLRAYNTTMVPFLTLLYSFPTYFQKTHFPETVFTATLLLRDSSGSLYILSWRQTVNSSTFRQGPDWNQEAPQCKSSTPKNQISSLPAQKPRIGTLKSLHTPFSSWRAPTNSALATEIMPMLEASFVILNSPWSLHFSAATSFNYPCPYYS